MKIERCDGCGAESPDEDGLHVANHWWDLESVHRNDAGGDRRVLVFCQSCADKVHVALLKENISLSLHTTSSIDYKMRTAALVVTSLVIGFLSGLAVNVLK